MLSFEAQLYILLDVAIAGLLAGVIGWERESAHKPVGLRTNMIIGAFAALIVLLGKVLVNNYMADIHGPEFKIDPTSIIQAVILSVSFIGAGSIIKTETVGGIKVRNLTTAATLLFSAGIGISVGVKQYVLAVGLTLMGLAINIFVKRIEDRFLMHGKDLAPKDDQ